MKRRPILLSFAALLVMLQLAACSAQSESLGGAELHSDGSGGAVTDSALSSPESMLLTEDRSIVRTGNIEIEVADVETASQDVAEAVSELGGEIASQQVSTSADVTRSASLTVRVPTERFSEAFDELSELGSVRSEQRTSDDVTEVHVDLAARVEALETSVGRLTDLLADAETTSDLLEIETALSERQAELDGLTAQLASLEGQIDEATISVWLTEPSVLPGGGPQTFWEALQAGIGSLGAFASGLVIFTGVALPWLLVLGLIGAAIIVPIGIRKRRRSSPGPTESVDNSQSD